MCGLHHNHLSSSPFSLKPKQDESHILCAVREIEQVCHGDKRVVQSFNGCYPLVCIYRQHLL